MPSHKRLSIADPRPTRGQMREVPVVEARDGHLPVDSPARLLHAQLNAGLIAPWHDAAAQHNEPRYTGLIRLAILFAGVVSSWAGVFLIIQLLR